MTNETLRYSSDLSGACQGRAAHQEGSSLGDRLESRQKWLGRLACWLGTTHDTSDLVDSREWMEDEKKKGVREKGGRQE